MSNKTTIEAKAKSLLESRQDYTDRFNMTPEERGKGRDIAVELIFGSSRYDVSRLAIFDAIWDVVDKDFPTKVIYITDKHRKCVTEYITNTVKGGDFPHSSRTAKDIDNPEYIKLFNDNFMFLTCGISLEDPDFPNVINNLLEQVKDENKALNYVVIIDNIDFNTESESLDMKSIIELYNNASKINARVKLLHKGENGTPEGGSIHIDCADIAREVIMERKEQRLRKIGLKVREDFGESCDECYKIKGYCEPLHWTIDDSYDFSEPEPTEKERQGIVRNPKTGLYELYRIDGGNDAYRIGTYYSLERAIDVKRSCGWLK